MKVHLILGVIAGSIVCLTPLRQADAQDTSTQGSRLREVTWNKSGTYEWIRPESVRYVLVRACGGGGGGGGGYSLSARPRPGAEGGTAAGGGGGAGSPVATILLGPLTAERYTIVIGRGGSGASSLHAAKMSSAPGTVAPGQSGTATSFTGQDIAFETPGAPGGVSGKMGTRISTEANVYEYFISSATVSGGSYPGGGSAQSGARGLLGLGGLGGVPGNSGGGGGSVGGGGAGGQVNDSGTNGGACAGGGGAGFLQGNANRSTGGLGGDGSLTLLSLATPVSTP